VDAHHAQLCTAWLEELTWVAIGQQERHAHNVAVFLADETDGTVEEIVPGFFIQQLAFQSRIISGGEHVSKAAVSCEGELFEGGSVLRDAGTKVKGSIHNCLFCKNLGGNTRVVFALFSS
jgi:hypothetical protein